MLNQAPIPKSLERRYLVVSGSFSCSQCKIRIGSDGKAHNMQPLSSRIILRRHESVYRDKHVIRVQRRRVTSRATFALKDLLSSLRLRILFIGIHGRFQRINKLTDRKDRFVAEAMCKLALFFVEKLVRAYRTVVSGADKYRISSNILRSSIYVSSSVIDVPAVLDPYQIRDFGHEIRATIKPRKRSDLRKAVYLGDLVGGHRLEAFVNVVF